MNPTLRDHIDEVLTVYTSSDNRANSQAFSAAMNVQFASQLAAQADWIMQNTDEDGNLQVSDDTITSTGNGNVVDNFDAAVGESYESLEQSIEDLEAIQ